MYIHGFDYDWYACFSRRDAAVLCDVEPEALPKASILWSVSAWLLLPHIDVYVLPVYNVDCMTVLQASMH